MLSFGLTLLPATYFQNYLPRGGAQSSSTLKSAVLAIFLHTNQQKTFQGTLGTQDHTAMLQKGLPGKRPPAKSPPIKRPPAKSPPAKSPLY